MVHVCRALVVLACVSTAVAAAQEVAFEQRSLAMGGESYTYALYVPEGTAPDKGWPLIVFLHGMGERGDDGVKQTTVGIGPAIKAHPAWFQCLVVMPQCRVPQWWTGGPMPGMIRAQIDAVMKDYPVDADRVSLTGLSMGGFGTWALGAKWIDRFSALGPICGGGRPEDAPVLSCLPIRCFHGGADRLVSPRMSRDMIEAVRGQGGEAEYTEYEGVGHNSWNRAYNTKDFIQWLQEQRRPAAPPLRYVPLVKGQDLSAWKTEGDAAAHWKIVSVGERRRMPAQSVLQYDGKGTDLWTRESFKDFLLKVKWRLPAPGDSGIYLRGRSKSQVNIWCNELGSGEVWGYRTDQSMPEEVRKAATPSARADKPVGEWNEFLIRMQGELLTVELNGVRVIDHARLPGVPAEGPIALQHHGNPIEFRDIAICRLPAGGAELFNGKDLAGWTVVNGGDGTWVAADGRLRCSGKPAGYLRTEKEYAEPYILAAEWRLLEPGQSGLLLHTQKPDKVWPASIEVQLDHTCFGNFVKIGNVAYKGGSRIANVEKPIGQWNSFLAVCRAGRIEVFMNGQWVSTATGCKPTKGFIGFQSEGVPSEFRDVRLYRW